MEKILANLKSIQKVFQKHKVVLVLAEKIAPAKYPQIRLRLLDEIGWVIKDRPIDLAILNNASPLLVQLAASKGKIIYCQDNNRKIEFQTQALKKFDDAIFLNF
jgi:predicted nucleotidyltransferase